MGSLYQNQGYSPKRNSHPKGWLFSFWKISRWDSNPSGSEWAAGGSPEPRGGLPRRAGRIPPCPPYVKISALGRGFLHKEGGIRTEGSWQHAGGMLQPEAARPQAGNSTLSAASEEHHKVMWRRRRHHIDRWHSSSLTESNPLRWASIRLRARIKSVNLLRKVSLFFLSSL